MQIIIREFASEDTARLKALIAEYNQFFENIDPWNVIRYGNTAVDFYFQQMLEQIKSHGKFFVIDMEGVIVGFIQGHIHIPVENEIMEGRDARSGEINHIYIQEKFRSKGLGKLLMEKMEVFFTKAGCKSIALNVFAPNIHAQEFYKKLGFMPRAMIFVKRLPAH